jgi:hypothetical protein
MDDRPGCGDCDGAVRRVFERSGYRFASRKRAETKTWSLHRFCKTVKDPGQSR